MSPSFTFKRVRSGAGTPDPRWRTSSRSAGNGECVEVGGWRVSRTCDGGACIEVGSAGMAVGVRDTKQNGAGPVLTFTPEAWRAFTTALARDSLVTGR